MDVLTHDHLLRLCDVFMVMHIKSYASCMFGKHGTPIHTFMPNGTGPMYRNHIQNHIRIMKDIARDILKSGKKTIIIAMSARLMVYGEYMLKLLHGCKFIIISMKGSITLDIDRLIPFESDILAIYSTHIMYHTFPSVFDGRIHLLPLGILSLVPEWCSLRRGHPTPLNPMMYVNFSTFCNWPVDMRYSFERTYIADELNKNGFHMSPCVEHHDMMDNMSRSMFCAAPHGAGMDSYRLWEALAAGCAVVTSDWLQLRRMFRAKLPALWITEWPMHEQDLYKPREIIQDLQIDEFGDMYLPKYGMCTYDALRICHRFVGWRRSSDFCRNILQARYWIAKILKHVPSF